MFTRTESFSEYIRFYPIVTILLFINISIFLITLLPGIGVIVQTAGIGVNYLIADGDWWRFVTPMFLHGGFMHILFNMFCLFVFGPELEKLTGKMRFTTLYMLSGIFANVATYFFQDLSYAHLGASGAIFGIFGAFGALIYYTKRSMPQLRQIILPIIVISIIMTFVGPNINATAHIAGLVVGFLIGLSYFNPKRILSWKSR
ncbi:rhomboid family intramembrane serine protease [Sporosarcina sp. Marseille-Q4063]|uniref:rhomboid family intramembrane serine protease n=1 Tax=Sporosarcina sp. Marseille-Q4063 TaxID=2810514 RepID=UPI001BAEE627|nr:rhomboid family intramembrane serine protease [Sporosarcina sp. Marseille-Q4063]QUW23725.1 rhomboid family intramembrane serine protease [Sporosarcina sp. Marseille-Q4063]